LTIPGLRRTPMKKIKCNHEANYEVHIKISQTDGVVLESVEISCGFLKTQLNKIKNIRLL